MTTDVSQIKKVDPLIGRTRIRVQITFQRDTGSTSYGAREHEDIHQIEAVIGDTAKPGRVVDLIADIVNYGIHLDDADEPLDPAATVDDLLRQRSERQRKAMEDRS